jgi:hypothetical protein
MSKTDITTEGSVCTVFLDDTPPAPVGPPPIPPSDVPDSALKWKGSTGKIASATSLTSDETVAIFGEADITVIPAILPNGGGVLYAQGGALKWKGSTGKITTIAQA